MVGEMTQVTVSVSVSIFVKAMAAHVYVRKHVERGEELSHHYVS